MSLPVADKIDPRCMGVTSYRFRCSQDATHCVRGRGFHRWACRQHLAQVADSVQRLNGERSLVIASISWQKGN